MYITKGGFPETRIRYLQNGGWGPVGLDSSIGPGPNSLNNSRVISIGGEYFTQGLGTKGPSRVQLNLGGRNRCYKLTAMVGIDDEIHIGGDKEAWGEFRVLNGSRILSSTTETLKARGLPPIKAKDPAMPISVTGLNSLSSFQLFADQPNATAYPFDFNNGHYNWATVKLYCGPDAPYMPIIRIDSPTGPTERSIGDVVQFRGSAFYYDRVTAITDPAAFQWTVLLIHCQGYLCHQHSEVDNISGLTGSFTVTDHAPDMEQYYYYQINLVVTDACGRRDRAVKTVLVKGFSRV